MEAAAPGALAAAGGAVRALLAAPPSPARAADLHSLLVAIARCAHSAPAGEAPDWEHLAAQACTAGADLAYRPVAPGARRAETHGIFSRLALMNSPGAHAVLRALLGAPSARGAIEEPYAPPKSGAGPPEPGAGPPEPGAGLPPALIAYWVGNVGAFALLGLAVLEN